MPPALSVVTPAYNGARYIAHTLDSVAALSVPHEHIVIDGGSTDGTVAILEARDDPALQWVSEPDRGQTHAMNKGFERATGEIVAWLNSDDEFIPKPVDRAVEFMLANPSVGAVFGGMHFTDESGTVRREYRPARYSWTRYLFLGDYIPPPSILFRRDLLERVGYLDETYVDAADYDLYLRLFHGSRVERRDEVMVRFRYHPESKSARDVWIQQREALAIRRKWGRWPGSRFVMTAIDRTKRAVLPRISAWPKPFT
ncbi:MAG: glycosyltransferase family 2 protein [Gaiellaceae bacterium]